MQGDIQLDWQSVQLSATGYSTSTGQARRTSHWRRPCYRICKACAPSTETATRPRRLIGTRPISLTIITSRTCWWGKLFWALTKFCILAKQLLQPPKVWLRVIVIIRRSFFWTLPIPWSRWEILVPLLALLERFGRTAALLIQRQHKLCICVCA